MGRLPDTVAVLLFFAKFQFIFSSYTFFIIGVQKVKELKKWRVR